MMTIHVEIDLTPGDEERSFLQALRTWERAHPHVQMAIKILATEQSTREAEDIFNQMEPPFPHIVRRRL
jgi:hypothetical protein